MEALHASHSDTFHTMVLDLSRVPVIDTTGFAALDDALAALVRRGKRVILAGPLPRPHAIFANARFQERHRGLIVVRNLDAARAVVAPAAAPEPADLAS
jgi:SulP family sulfate permease